MTYEHDASEFRTGPTEDDMLQEAIGEAWDKVRASLTELVESLKKDIREEYRSPGSEDDGPSMQLTVGHNLRRCKTDPEFVENGWTYQTGDNSFTGGAYLRPDWAVVDLTPDCDAEGVVDEILSQFSELEAM